MVLKRGVDSQPNDLNKKLTLLLILGLDDPLDAVAVHLGGGILGVLCVPFFKYSTGIFWIVKNTNDPNFDFESEDYQDPGRILGINIAGLLAIILWSGFWSTFIFGGLQYFDNLRIDEITEIKGNDIVSKFYFLSDECRSPIKAEQKSSH